MVISSALPKGGAVVFLLGILMAMSACGQEPTGKTSETVTTQSVVASQSTTTAPPSATPSATAPSSNPAGQLTVSGVIIEGLRSHCRILQTEQRRYALTGAGTARLQQGDRVTVTGHERSDLVNPCGLTFVVASMK
jgi:hypothetical protein